MKKITMSVLAAVLVGCTSGPAPNFYNGRYYMAGDPTCKNLRGISQTRIMCSDAQGKDTGWRDAMTDQQIQMFQFQQMQQQQSSADLDRMIAANNQAMSARQIPQYSAPNVMPLSRPGGDQVRCISAGIYMNCRQY
jgi:hypothetical protein